MVGRARPVRTCVGCRERAPATELLRVVALIVPVTNVALVVPDPARRRPGRGAHLHLDPACLDLAVRRRAFGRALRVTAVTVGDELVAQVHDHTDGVANEVTPGRRTR